MIYSVHNCAALSTVIDGRTQQEIELVMSIDTDKLMLVQFTNGQVGDDFKTVERKLEAVSFSENEDGLPELFIVMFAA